MCTGASQNGVRHESRQCRDERSSPSPTPEDCPVIGRPTLAPTAAPNLHFKDDPPRPAADGRATLHFDMSDISNIELRANLCASGSGKSTGVSPGRALRLELRDPTVKMGSTPVSEVPP